MDNDGWGDPNNSETSCGVLRSQGYVKDNTDCDDNSADINPEATEVCNGIDDNCSGTIDNVTAELLTTFYEDSDGDTYGNFDIAMLTCFASSGYVDNSDDCDDTAAAIHPGAVEVCNGKDDNCSGTIDDVDSTEGETFYQDADGDGFGNLDITTTACPFSDKL